MTTTRTAHMRGTTMFFDNRLAITCLACSSTSSKVSLSLSLSQRIELFKGQFRVYMLIYWLKKKISSCEISWCIMDDISLPCFLSHLTLGKGRIESPLETVNFLDDWKIILESRFTAASVEECMDSAGSVCYNDTVALFS